jgi:hypothetical protein
MHSTTQIMYCRINFDLKQSYVLAVKGTQLQEFIVHIQPVKQQVRKGFLITWF